MNANQTLCKKLLSPPPILEVTSNFAPNFLRAQIMHEWDPEFLLWREDKVAVDTAIYVCVLARG